MASTPYRRMIAPLRWREVDVLEYKAQGSAPFRDVTRQVLFDDPALASQLRYFEVAPGGHTTLERHEHAHPEPQHAEVRVRHDAVMQVVDRHDAAKPAKSAVGV